MEQRVQLRNLQDVVNLLGWMQKLQLAAYITDRRKAPDQGVDARTVNVVDVREVQQDLFAPAGEQTPDSIA